MPIYFKQSPWTSVRRCAGRDGIAVIPFGSLEQHGPHLPCGTDTFEIDEIVSRAVSGIDADLPVCICPTIEYSVVQWASPMASAGLSPRMLERCVTEVCHALTDLGFTKILLVYGHSASAGLTALWQSLYEKRPAMYVNLEPYERCWKRLVEIAGLENHASLMETSMMLAIRPDLVDMSKATNCPPHLDPQLPIFDKLRGPGLYVVPTVEWTPEGHCGTDPRGATADIGHKLLDTLARCIAEVLTTLAAAPTPPELRRIWRKPLPKDD
jgi:creatinine amidohydrolase